jgi:mannan endo-1,4-beta-mannosidase
MFIIREKRRGSRRRGAGARARRASITLGLALAASGLMSAGAAEAQDGNVVVKRAGRVFKVHGQELRFAGANNYYLMYKSPFMVDDVLSAAAAQGYTVIRTRASIDVGNADGSNSVSGSDGRADGTVYFQFWGGTAPAYNDGASGLQHLDYAIARAGQLGIKLIIPLVNNWKDFGGIDQYVRWSNGQFHDQFYTDATLRAWFKAWIAHLLNRVNTITGVRYKDDPTIMAWELANEPRCRGSGVYPTSAGCSTQTLIAWADEMSHYVKSQSPQQLLTVGDEGFYCAPGATDWTENCSEGVDTVALAQLPQVDFMSFHLYPDLWGKTVAWGTDWINRHYADAQSINKPAVLGEFGLEDASTRNPNYKLWTDAAFQADGAGALYWILVGKQDNGTLYPAFDRFTVYCPSAVCTTISHFAAMMTVEAPLSFAPVADDDVVVTPFGTPVTLNPPANDVSSGGATIVAASLDLDPATAGQQTTLSLAGGTFVAAADGSVAFTPAAGFAGTLLVPYAIQDSIGRVSNVALLNVTVNTDPKAAIVLASFETGTEGWSPLNGPAGTVEQTTAFHTLGSYGLEIDAVSDSWWGTAFGAERDLSAKTHVKWDVSTLVGTSQELAIQSGDGWVWCQWGGFAWLNAGTTTTMDIDLSTPDACFGGSPDMTNVHTVYIYGGNGGAGTFYLDNVRAE